nr:VWA domain-containing protein [Aliihoeflea sp. 40Bstr573]
MSATAEASETGAADADPMERELRMRPALLDAYRAARHDIRRHLAPADIARWSDAMLRLYRANAGPALLGNLWTLQRRVAAHASPDTLLSISSASRELCLHGGARGTAQLVDAVGMRLTFGDDGAVWAQFLAGVAALAPRAPELAGALAETLPALAEALDPPDMVGWAEDALRLYPLDRRRRLAYLRLDDPMARQRLSAHEGAARFDAHRNRLAYLARALFERELQTQTLAARGPRAYARTRLAGSVVLMPELAPRLPSAQAERFFEAAVLHALAHQAFTSHRFAVGKMKPLQLALVSLLEDARVERLAMQRFPGLARLWLPFHTARPMRARSSGALLARLARTLADQSVEDDDQWVRKGSSLFEQAFAERPHDQSFCEVIVRVLGHDLGQMRIPFDAKSYLVDPAYRDDGLGLFELDDPEDADPDTLDIMLDAARMEPGRTDDGAGDDSGAEAARSRAAEAEADKGPLLGHYPEWDHRLHTDTMALTSVYAEELAALQRPHWLNREIDARRRETSRIGAMVRRARMGPARRLKKRLDGDDLDLDALVEMTVARRSGETPDPRIYTVKRRTERNISMALLIDTSESTAAHVAASGGTILQTAAVATGLFGTALDELGDDFAVFTFCSDGPDNVRLGAVKDFTDGFGEGIDRLAALRPGLSTRLGAALRHVARRLDARPSLRKVMIVVTDGEPADRDIDDPDHLVEDARRAVLQARADGLDLFCVALGNHADRAASRVFGRRNTLLVERVADLPSRLAGLYFRLTVN